LKAQVAPSEGTSRASCKRSQRSQQNKWGRDLWSWAGWLAQDVAIVLEESKIPQVLVQGELKHGREAGTQPLICRKIRGIPPIVSFGVLF